MQIRWRWSPTSLMVLAAVLVGLGLRAYHYLRAPSVWHDEAALIVNVLKLDYDELLGPLIWHEASPPLFLWLHRTVVLHLGDDVFSLRLPSFLASCAALLLLVPLASRLLPTRAVPWCLLLFAVSERLAFHGCEAKAYSFDVLAAVLLPLLYVWLRSRSLVALLLLCAALAPVLIFLSYPACFLFGGLLLALFPACWREGRGADRIGYVVLALVVVGSFALLALGPAKAQRDGAMLSCWTAFFPDWSRPWSVPLWAVDGTLDVGNYCFRPGGELVMLLAIVGAVSWWRQGRRELVTLLSAPLLLTLMAALVGRYPYGGARVMLYAAPALAVLAAGGLEVIVTALASRSRRMAFAVVVLALAPACWGAISPIVRPWGRADAAGAAAWIEEQRRPGDLVLGNDWPHFYYFRHLGDAFRPCPVVVPSEVERVWLVFVDPVPERRERLALDELPNDWRPVARRDFERTTVFLFERSTIPPTAAAH